MRFLDKITGKPGFLFRYCQRHAFVFGENRSVKKITNFLVYMVEAYFRIGRVRSKPWSLFIDPINICPLKCPLCTTGLRQHTRPRQKMTLDELKSYLSDLLPTLYLVKFYNYGEPFLNPELPDMIAHVHQNRSATQVNSNLNIMDRDMAERTIRAGLDRLVVSFDGLQQETYGAYRLGGDVDKVKAHIQLFNDLKKKLGSKKPHIVLQYLINRHNEGEIHKTREYAGKIGAEFFPTPIMLDITNRTQREEWLPGDDNLTLYDREKRIKKKASPQKSCGFLWNDPVINVDGGVAPCCHLFHKSMDFGHLGQESFSDIWNNPAFVRGRWIFKTRSVQARNIACERCVNPKGFNDPAFDLINEYKTNQLK